MKEYKRCTDKNWREFDTSEMYKAFAELEDKIEQRKMIEFKYKRGDQIYYIGYTYREYACPHCGETCYEEKADSVEIGCVVERIATENQDGLDFVYTIQTNNVKPILFTKRNEKDIFLTKAEAEARLKELQNGR